MVGMIGGGCLSAEITEVLESNNDGLSTFSAG